MTAEKNVRILVIDDNRAIHDDFRKILCPATNSLAALDAAEEELFGTPAPAVPQSCFTVDSAYQGAEGLRLVQQALDAGRPYALAFMDVRMPPGIDGVETARKMWELDPDLQMVICTAYSDYSWSEMFAVLGHRDGLLILKKPFDTVEAFQLAHALTEKWRLHQESKLKLAELSQRVIERTAELQQSNHALKLQETELRLLFNMMPAMVWFKDTRNGFLRVNQRVAEATGLTIDEIEGRTAEEIFPKEAAGYYADDLQVIRSGTPKLGIVEKLQGPQGQELWVQTDKMPVCDPDGKVTALVAMVHDITARKQAEQALRESEERFAGAFMHAPIGVALVAPDGRWQKVNRALCQLLGYTEEELLSRTFQDITHPADLPVQLEYVRRMLAREIHTYQMEKRYIHAGGHFITALLNVSLVYDAQDQLRYSIAQIQDMTGLKQTEETLQMLHASVLQARESILITDAELDPPGPKIIFVNPAFTRMTGYTAAEVIGKTPRILQGPRTDKAVLARLRHKLERGELFEGEAVNYRKDGTEFDLEWQIAPIRNAGGTVTHFVATQRDVTRRNRLEAQVRQSQKLETLSRRASGAALEFDSILTTITNHSALILSTLPTDSPLAKSATEIRHSAARAATLTLELLA